MAALMFGKTCTLSFSKSLKFRHLLDSVREIGYAEMRLISTYDEPVTTQESLLYNYTTIALFCLYCIRCAIYGHDLLTEQHGNVTDGLLTVGEWN